MAAVLQSQMAEIKRREEEAALMERERAGLLREQAELEKVVSSATTVCREPSLLVVLICFLTIMPLLHPIVGEGEATK